MSAVVTFVFGLVLGGTVATLAMCLLIIRADSEVRAAAAEAAIHSEEPTE